MISKAYSRVSSSSSKFLSFSTKPLQEVFKILHNSLSLNICCNIKWWLDEMMKRCDFHVGYLQLNKHNIQEDKRTLFGLNYLLNTPKSKVGFLTTFYPC